MRLEKIVARSRIVDLRSTDMKGALGELLAACGNSFPDLKQEALLRALLQRESTMTTYLGEGVALPHVRVKMGRRYILAIGRSRVGISNETAAGDEKSHLIFMLLADEKARDYLQLLASIARLLKDPELVRALLDAPTTGDVFDRLVAGFGGIISKPVQAQQNRINRLMIREADRVAKGAACGAIMVFGDTFVGGIEPGAWFPKSKTILVTRNMVDLDENDKDAPEVIQVRSYSSRRLAQLRSAMFVALTRGMISFSDRVCCVGGIAGSNQFDTVVIVDVEREFQTLLTGHTDLLPDDVKPEVLERVIAIATELAVEGREGKPVGCLFVVGDAAKVEKLIKPLVLNPFYGYKEEDRNILSPFMDETVKEFSSIDGAFVIRGDGVVSSAGSLIQAADSDHILPSGLGSRHAAAAAISVASECISIVVSSSTGQVTLFRRGVMLPLTEKKMGAAG
ncbi:MAG TPA: diadenylate cyclase [Rariglobus sp.]|jgi:DNA integrity scanning protein DisA with diadenylate cyclase activity/mannitol/fructose-specific phosphotransferase system IIA component (Ntr-type)|nr:diadenylate cyclase [Rariglobus sp.]